MPKFDGAGNLVGFATGRPASLWQAVRTLVKEGYPLEHLLPLVTENPARVLGIADRKGSIEEGKDADLLVLGEDLSIERVYAKGRLLVEEGKPGERGHIEQGPGREAPPGLSREGTLPGAGNPGSFRPPPRD